MTEESCAVDLTNCDREPIHIPGAIQSHGWLLALDAQSLALMQASANVVELAGRPLDELLGQPLAMTLGSARMHFIPEYFYLKPPGPTFVNLVQAL